MATILIIEDEPVVVNLLKRIIASIGHEVRVADNGQAGLEMACAPDVAVIVSDLHMPGEPAGMALVRKLRALRPKCPIVIVSGYPSAETLAECEQLGITDFLTKPFEMTFVHTVITGLLGDKPAAPKVK